MSYGQKSKITDVTWFVTKREEAIGEQCEQQNRDRGKWARREGWDGEDGREFRGACSIKHSSSRERFMRRCWRGSVIVISLLSLPPTVISFLSSSHSFLLFFTFNLDHPNGSITHVRLPPRGVCERKGCVVSVVSLFWSSKWLKMGFIIINILFCIRNT